LTARGTLNGEFHFVVVNFTGLVPLLGIDGAVTEKVPQETIGHLAPGLDRLCPAARQTSPPRRVGEVCRRGGDLLSGHLVDAIDDLEERTGRIFEAPNRDEIGRVERGVIGHVVDDVEARRLARHLSGPAGGQTKGLLRFALRFDYIDVVALWSDSTA
jgi:hypothetical protein